MPPIFGRAKEKGSELNRKIEKLERELSAIKQIGVDRYLKDEWHQESFAAGCDAGIYVHNEALERERELKRERDDWQTAYEKLAMAVEKERKAHKVGQ
jgi:hypothetical protein